MCAGAMYWANIGTVVYAMTEKDLLVLTGSDEQNPTFAVKYLHADRKILLLSDLSQSWHRRQQKFIRVTGTIKQKK